MNTIFCSPVPCFRPAVHADARGIQPLGAVLRAGAAGAARLRAGPQEETRCALSAEAGAAAGSSAQVSERPLRHICFHFVEDSRPGKFKFSTCLKYDRRTHMNVRVFAKSIRNRR